MYLSSRNVSIALFVIHALFGVPSQAIQNRDSIYISLTCSLATKLVSICTCIIGMKHGFSTFHFRQFSGDLLVNEVEGRGISTRLEGLA